MEMLAIIFPLKFLIHSVCKASARKHISQNTDRLQ